MNMRTTLILAAAIPALLASCAREGNRDAPVTQKEVAKPQIQEPAIESPVMDAPSPLAPDVFFQALRKSVVLVINTRASTLGSGVEIGNGLFVTNCHVLEGGDIYSLRRDGRVFSASLEAGSTKRDICLLRGLDSESYPVKIRSSDSVEVGERVYALGNPQGLELTLSEGIVSQLRSAGTGEVFPYIQTTAPISQGSSGGGLFDLEGNLIGIPSFMSKEGQNLNFAAPIDWAVELQSGSYTERSQVSEPEDAAPLPESPSDLNAKAISLINAGSPQDAIPLLESAIEQDPRNAEILGNLGYAYLKAKRHADARDQFEASLDVSPNRAATWLNLGQTMAELGHQDLAVQSVIKGYELSSRKSAVLAAIVKAESDSTESERWRDVARRCQEILQPETSENGQ